MVQHASKPPKCYHTEEKPFVEWALRGFCDGEKEIFQRLDHGKPKHHSLDCSILELADDIAYGIHDIEDIVARGLASREEVRDEIKRAFDKVGGGIQHKDITFNSDFVCSGLLGDSFSRKQMISNLVNLFITSIEVTVKDGFKHPLLRFNVDLSSAHGELLKILKGLAYQLVIRKAKVQQLERRGQMIVEELFKTLLSAPKDLIPQGSWDDGVVEATDERRVCDYIAGMTDTYTENLYKRLFQPGFGSSGDEL